MNHKVAGNMKDCAIKDCDIKMRHKKDWHKNNWHNKNTHNKNWIKKTGIVLFWLACWSVLAVTVDNKIILAAPWQTAGELGRMLLKSSFYLSAARSLLRISLGFLSGFLAAVLLAAAGRRFPFLEELFEPAMKLIKTVPVASFVVLLLIWWGSSFLASAICFLVVLPNVYISALEGLKAADGKLLEMAKVFHMPLRNRFFYIYRPALKPFLYSGLKISLGMCWKSGVAAEVIATPEYTVGEQLYLSKVFLNTAGVFAWTAVVILLSIVFEKIVMRLTERFFRWEPACKKSGASAGKRLTEASGGCGGKSTQQTKAADAESVRRGTICLQAVTKSFGGQPVLKGLFEEYERGKTYFLTTPSGSGKTTKLHLMAGILKPDSGVLRRPDRVSMVFQEDRLCEEYDAVKNVELVTGDARRAEAALLRLLPEEALRKPCAQLSGGMKRRVAVVRAMEAESEAVLLDEPYTGMDEDTKMRTKAYIRERQKGRLLIVATHIF